MISALKFSILETRDMGSGPVGPFQRVTSWLNMLEISLREKSMTFEEVEKMKPRNPPSIIHIAYRTATWSLTAKMVAMPVL
jgi:hypothetical protein